MSNPADLTPRKSARPPVPTVNVWLVAALLVTVSALMLKNAGLFPSALHNPLAEPRAITSRGDLADDEKSTIEIFQAASPSVVHITATTEGYVQRGPSLTPLEIPEGTGTGFIWDTDGHVVTNFHVIRNASGAHVSLADNTSWKAKLVGYEPDKDLAVLKIDATPGQLKPLPIGSSEDLQVGQKVFAIGNPFGLDRTLTTGIISGLGREIKAVSGRMIEGVIQTDAAINPGNSGGPLLDSAGRLIGVNTAIVSPSGTSAGVGFAVPVDTVNQFVPELIRTGRIERAGLGAKLLPDPVARRLGIEEGVLIFEAVAGSAAAQAGLEGTEKDADGRWLWGDIITAVDDQPIHGTNDLFRVLEGHRVGESVTLTINRQGKTAKVPIKLQAVPRD